MEFSRKLNIYNHLKTKSAFLLGPRGVGKSYWIRKTLPPEVLTLNLLSSDLFLRLAESPSLLREMVHKSGSRVVAIDEIQKLPILLDEAQILIEEHGVHFLLTGSSARKLRRENANLLGGRAGQLRLFPLVSSEIPGFDLERFLRFGGLPRIYPSEEPEVELDAYLSVYLEQEIKAESLVRNLVPFHRFLKAAALSNGELINYANISNDTGIPASTVREYYTILDDTLVGIVLEPLLASKKRKAIQTSKFYFFDTGVCNQILGIQTLERNSNLWGKSFEQFLCMELRSFLSYAKKRQRLCFWRSINKQEVDFVLEDPGGDSIAIEVKATRKVTDKHLSGLRTFMEEKLARRHYLVSEDPIARETGDGIQIVPWHGFLSDLWGGKIA